MDVTQYPAWINRLAEATAPRPQKPCDGCTACCHTIAVAELGLATWQRCPHERGFPYVPSCAIYDRRPSSCRVWSCQYALEGWDDDLRPDRCGVVADPLVDLIRLCREDGGEPLEVAAVQLYAAPGYEEAYQRQPVLAVVLAALASVGVVMWRYRDAAGRNVGMALMRDPETGELTHTAAAVEDGDFGMSAGQRLLRAQQLLRGGKP
jgi:hypothetical protein